MTHISNADLQKILSANPDLILVTDGQHTTIQRRPVVRDHVTRITLDYPPSANRYWRFGKRGVYRSEEANAYKEEVGRLCQSAGMTPMDGDVSLTLHFYRPARRGDLDNRIKILVDALQSYAYHNDSQVAEIHAIRHDNDPQWARVEVTIEPIGAKK